MAGTTYTFTQKAAPSNPESNFAGMAADGNRVAMTGAIGSGMMTQDATGTPVTSPATVSNLAVTTINIPANAVQMVVNVGSASAVNFSEKSDASAQVFQIQSTDGIQYIDVARQSVIYMKAATASVSVWFYFKVV